MPSTSNPCNCKICGFALGHDEGLADRICDQCSDEILEHQRELNAAYADDDPLDLDYEDDADRYDDAEGSPWQA